MNRQLDIIEAAFLSPATMLMIAEVTGIERANIYRYVAVLRDAGGICVHHRGECSITGYKANYYTTNVSLIKSKKRHGEGAK
jgi:hypothetical protein